MVNYVKQTLTVPAGFSVKILIDSILKIVQSQSEGRIYLKTRSEERWWIDFQVGNLTWSSGGIHRFRRWQRMLRQFCPDAQTRALRLREQKIYRHWEYLILRKLVEKGEISPETAISLITANIEEVLFDICHSVASLSQITYTTDQQTRLGKPLRILSVKDLFCQVQSDLQSWQLSGMGAVSPNFSPVMRNREKLLQLISPQAYKTLSPMLKGQQPMRDLALITRHDLYTLGRTFAKYWEKEILDFKRLADIPNPYDFAAIQAATKPTIDLPLVLCVDDSPQIGYIMTEILTEAGFRCVCIQDSLQAVVQIIRQKPSVIFLDLIMPVANGYEICKQIRRIKAFRKTPIIIMTGNDGVVDRVRAKAVGATGFLGKPVDPEKVVSLVREITKQQAPPAPTRAKTPLIFCVDDSPQIGYIMGEAVREAGYRFFAIQDSVKAVVQVIRQKPDMIFLDLVMPGANGYEICKQIRRIKAFRKTPIVIMTGNDGVVDRVRAKAAGATGFMAKPLDAAKVIALVKSQVKVKAG